MNPPDLPTSADGARDVLVVGSGAAGLCAALAAAAGGATVTVLEGSHRWGGATAVSDGQIWVPCNHHMSELGVDDSIEEARIYLLGRTRGRDASLADAFLRAAPSVVRFLEEQTPLEFTPTNLPDSYAEAPGGRIRGRNLEVAPLAPTALEGLAPGDPRELFWPAPRFGPYLTNEEMTGLGLLTGGALPHELIGQRKAAGLITLGAGLVAGLLAGCVSAGVDLRSGHRVTGLVLDGTAVTGVRVGDVEFRANHAVVLASGGFEHDRGLCERLLNGPYAHHVTPPVAHGDALRMAAEAGAALSHPHECWSWPVTGPPDSVWDDGTPRPVPMTAERMLPHCVWVNARGHRFVNESGHNAAMAFAETDPDTGRPRNLPAWAVADARYRARYPFAGAPPGDPLPAHAVEGDTLAELAERTGIAPAALAETIRRFNTAAERGADPDFGRGAHAYDREGGDPTASHPNLGPVTEPPFCAVPVLPGTAGTNGGPVTDAHARVLRWNGEPVSGLFAAGNAMASPIGPGFVSPGAGIGLALTWGWIAGTSASADG